MPPIPIAPPKREGGMTIYLNPAVRNSSSLFEPCAAPKSPSYSRKWLLKVGRKLRLVGKKLSSKPAHSSELSGSVHFANHESFISEISLCSSIGHLFVYTPKAMSPCASSAELGATCCPGKPGNTTDFTGRKLLLDSRLGDQPTGSAANNTTTTTNSSGANPAITEQVLVGAANDSIPDLSYAQTMSGSIASPATNNSEDNFIHGGTEITEQKTVTSDLSGDLSTKVAPADEEDEEVSDEELTNPGYREWKRRRREWTRGSYTVNPKQSLIASVPEHIYPNIYDALVKKSRPLKQPINLSDAIKVIKAGWVADGTWPTQ